jgi:hypothetical protein
MVSATFFIVVMEWPLLPLMVMTPWCTLLAYIAVLLQSLLLLVVDTNDNPPLFIQPQTSVTVKASGE